MRWKRGSICVSAADAPFKPARSEEGVWGLVPRQGVWGMKSPNVPMSRSEKKSRQGAKRNLTVIPLSRKRAVPAPTSEQHGFVK